MGYMNSRNSQWKPNDGWNKDCYFNEVNNRNITQSKRNHHHVRSDIQSFYITNFSESVLPSDLWRVCGRLGKIVDVFVSKKQS